MISAMPWHIEANNPNCSGWAVVKDDDGSIAGCHDTEGEAQAQMAALYANEPTMTAADLPGPDPYEGMPEVPCYGVLAPEGIPDGNDPPQEFAPGALTWAPLPFSFKWQEKEDEGHEGACVVGRIDAIWRDGALIRWVGAIDNVGEYGRELIRLREANFVRGVSIMADDITEAEIEYVYPAPMPMPEMPMPMTPPASPPPGDMQNMAAPPMDMPMMDMHEEMCDPIKMIFHAGRIRSATVVAEPAFVEATFELGESPIPVPVQSEPTAAGETVMVAAAVAPHSTATSDAPWDGPANEKQLPSPMPVAKARAAYAFIDDGAVKDGQVTKEACRFIHHEVGADGNVGAANIKACQSGIGVLNGGRGGTNIPGDSRQGVYDHLAKHLRDAGLEPAPMTASVTPQCGTLDPNWRGGPTIVAAGNGSASWTITIPEVWPESWFEEPTDVPPIGALNITASGRIYGYLAPGNVSHRGFRGSGRTVYAPRNIDYSEFQNKACIVAGADGQVYKINAGNVTFDCGHASPMDPRRADPSWAAAHYENSCSIAARVRVGENRNGTWVAGALLHGITPDTVERMMACALSGDWQDGKLKGALLVPVEGFPRAQTASVRVREDAMVASSVPVVFEEPKRTVTLAGEDYDALVAAAFAAFAPEVDDRFASYANERFDEIARERG